MGEVGTSTLSVAFIPREKYSKSVESLEALVGELPIPSQIVIFDTGYPKCIKEELLGIVTRLKLQHTVDIVELGGFVNTNKILSLLCCYIIVTIVRVCIVM